MWKGYEKIVCCNNVGEKSSLSFYKGEFYATGKKKFKFKKFAQQKQFT